MKQNPYDFRPMSPDELKDYIADRVARDYAAKYNESLQLAERFKAALLRGKFKIVRHPSAVIEISIWKMGAPIRPDSEAMRNALNDTFHPIGYTCRYVTSGFLSYTINLVPLDPTRIPMGRDS